LSHPTDDRNFRLPPHVRPLLYAAELSIDLEGRRFEGRETISLRIDEPADEIILHAVGLEIASAQVRASGELQQAAVRHAAASETAVLGFPRRLPAGHAELSLSWRGAMGTGLRGLYPAGPMASTQFEAADARRVFPCFDEPAFKATWALVVEAPAGATVLANGAPERVEQRGGRQRVTFHETPPLPTYLVAVACGAIEGGEPGEVRGVPVRTWAVPGKAALGAFGQEVALAALPLLEDYFGLPYAFGKLDQLGVPEFEAGAMENAGLITYREAALLLDPAKASLGVKKRIAEVVTHELAHQWFGNWVTMAWWDDLWLNESFATWMAFKIVDQWRPAWRMWLEFDAHKAGALALDALRSTHPIRAEVKNPEDMGESFDLITYEKGGAVLRMIEAYLGEGPFRDGIRLYLRRHARANAVADDLWAALAEASGQPVVELANAWIGSDGHPVVQLRRQGDRVELSQRRFLSGAGEEEPGRTWPVPLVIRFRDEAGVHEHRSFLRAAEATLRLPARGAVAWVFGNAGASGFYRVDHGPEGVAELAGRLGDLQIAERIALLADEWALLRRGDRPVADLLDLAVAFGGEEDHAVLDELVLRLAALEGRLLDAGVRDRFQAFARGLLAPRLAAMGWEARPGEGDGPRLARAALLRGAGIVGRDPGAAAEAQARLDRMLAGDAGALEPNLHEAAVALAARGGGAARFDELRGRFEREQEPAFRRRYLVALALFEDPGQAQRALEMALGEQVPLQEVATFVGALLGNRAARDGAWALLRGRWGAVAERLAQAPFILRRIVEAVGLLPERRHLEEAQAFFAAQEIPPARQAVAQTLERMRQDLALAERATPEVDRWLARRRA